MVRRVHEKAERNLEDRIDFRRVGYEIEPRFDNRENRRDAESGHGQVIREAADHLHEAGIKCDLFLRLALGGEIDTFVIRIHRPARKGNLSGVLSQRGRPLRQDHPRLIAVVDHRDQDGGVAQTLLVDAEHHVGVESVIAMGKIRWSRSGHLVFGPMPAGTRAEIRRVEALHGAVHQLWRSSSAIAITGKVAPSERMTNMAMPSISASSPCSRSS